MDWVGTGWAGTACSSTSNIKSSLAVISCVVLDPVGVATPHPLHAPLTPSGVSNYD